MREYLFHGKRVDNGEWVEGYLVYNKARKQYYIMDDVDSFPVPVHKDSVGQWTGIYDINQRKIFENDIVRTQPYLDRPYSKNRQSKQFIGVVEYYTCHFKNNLNDLHEQIYDAGWKVKVKDYGKYTHGAWSDFYECEVIGTAFDNADLLEG